ncbi:MAG: hypothetical protein [Olavius algarvensis Gamma 1 endosymbiont]|nr:MAG: hypothetical protein [Olavius algarvensis Gamma 1 endosymbiont]
MRRALSKNSLFASDSLRVWRLVVRLAVIYELPPWWSA